MTSESESVNCSVVSWLFVTPWTGAHQAPLSTGFSRRKYRSGLPFPSPGDLSIFPTQELNPGLLHLRQILYHLNYPVMSTPPQITMKNQEPCSKQVWPKEISSSSFQGDLPRSLRKKCKEGLLSPVTQQCGSLAVFLVNHGITCVFKGARSIWGCSRELGR